MTRFVLIALVLLPTMVFSDPLDRVDPFIGVDVGNCVVGPLVPYGSIHPSPQTLDIYGEDWRFKPFQDGYSTRGEIVGFAHLHGQGNGGTPSYGQLLLSPQVGLETNQVEHRSEKSDEVATVGYYAVTLDRYGVRCEVTPTHHTALHRFTFSDGDSPTIVLNIARKIGGPSLIEGSIAIEAEEAIVTGTALYTGNWRPDEFPLHFAIRFDRQPLSWGVFEEGAVIEAEKTLVRSRAEPTDQAGCFLRFGTTTSNTIMARVSLSFHSIDRARRWLDEELPGWDFAAIRTAAENAWREKLAKIDVEASAEQETIFYTALYHTMTNPRDRTGDMTGFAEGAPVLDDQLTLWDTYRTVWPLKMLIETDVVTRNLEFYSNVLDRFGFVGTAFLWGKTFPSAHQGGTEVDHIVADAIMKGIAPEPMRSFDIIRENAFHRRSQSYLDLGYSAFDEDPISASSTVAFAANDFSAAVAANALNLPTVSQELFDRSRSWRNVWDDGFQLGEFKGWIRPRGSDGSFPDLVTPTTGYYESFAGETSFLVPHAVHELIERVGGPESFVGRLDELLNSDFRFNNEPSFPLPWLYTYAGRPDKTAETIRAFLDRFTLERYPGQEDGGAMSSFCVFAMSGLFPVPGQAIYLLHPPTVARSHWELADGRSLQVSRVGEQDHSYISSIELNGRRVNRAWVHHSEIAGGAHLIFHMTDDPETWTPDPPPSGSEVLRSFSTAANPPLVRTALRSGGVLFSLRDLGPPPHRLRLFDVAGRLVRTLAVDKVPIGPTSLYWDGTSDRGTRLGAGVYFYQLSTERLQTSGPAPLIR